ncbi:MAG: hypothetical protein AAF531_26865 [Actinomycetota bacterium]
MGLLKRLRRTVERIHRPTTYPEPRQVGEARREMARAAVDLSAKQGIG